MSHRPFTTCALASVLLLGTGSRAAAQTDARLVQAVELAQNGGRDSATVLVREVQKTAPAGSALYAEALYTAGMLATDPDTMRRMLQQVIVEQSLSPWADDALLRLAQLDYAGGNLPAAMRDLERLRADFPRSDVFAEAAFWAARTYFDARQERPGCEWVGMGLARAGDTATTVRDQLGVFARRCSATALADGSAKAPPGPPRDTIVLVQAGRPEAGKTDSVVAGLETIVDSRQSTVDSQRTTLDSQQSTVSSQESPIDGRPPTADPRPAADPGVLVARLDTTTRDARPETVYRVQVVAAATQAAADENARKVREFGYEPHIAVEGGYFKVRAGGYSSRADATAAVRRLRDGFPGAFLVVDK